ncbi:MAG: hypothetical protein MK086_09920 [Flavobacteriales bacterium]|nr:hypothetical protein [Flavobacteriales bacterium]
MKTNLLRFNLFKGLIILITGLILTYQSADAQTIDIGPNEYAFRFTGNPNFGLFFNATTSQYEFRNGSANAVFAIGAANGNLNTNLQFASGSDYLVGPDRYAFRYANQPNFGLVFNNVSSQYEFRDGSANPIFAFSALNGQMKTDLQFAPSASYRVAPNNYAIRSAASANIGLYFGPTDYEFRNSSGASVLNINANTGEIVSTASISADGGNSSEWSEAHGWGDHATAGYINTESDPKVGSLSGDAIPSWNGTQLTNSNMNTIVNGVEVEGTSGRVSINSTGFLGGSSKVGFSNLDQENGYVQMGLGILQIMNKTELGSISFGNNNILHSVFDSEGRLGVNSTTPNGRLTVNGESDLTEDVISAVVNYDGNADVVGVDAISVTAPGFGYGVRSTGGYMAVRATGSGQDYVGVTYGVYGESIGTAGTRIGIYGTANGGSTNWAMWSAGNHYVSGDLRIGSTTAATGYKLSVNGRAICEELKVQLNSDWPDYVFEDDYEMMDLDELKNYIDKENHLPGIPSAQKVEEDDGILLGEMQRVTVEKLEELTLYILELKEENEQLKERIEALEN